MDSDRISFLDSKDLLNIKEYRLSSIKKIQYPKVGKGIEKHVKFASVVEERFAILTIIDK